MSVDSQFKLGSISVHATENEGHTPEFWAAQAAKKNYSNEDLGL